MYPLSGKYIALFVNAIFASMSHELQHLRSSSPWCPHLSCPPCAFKGQCVLGSSMSWAHRMLSPGSAALLVKWPHLP